MRSMLRSTPIATGHAIAVSSLQDVLAFGLF